VIPEDLKYTDAHEWVGVTADGTVRVGITDYAQNQLGDVVFVQLPDVGQRIAAGAAVGEIESTKSVSDLFAPVSGEVPAGSSRSAPRDRLRTACGACWTPRRTAR
jgi:glycine cleavage system H protein